MRKTFFRAIFTLAFFSMARIGELIPVNIEKSSKVLQLENVNFEYSFSKLTRLLISYCHFKHNISNIPHTIPVVKCLDNPGICAVDCLQRFLVRRGPASGPLFLTQYGSVLLRSRFDKVTKLSLSFCGLDSSRYKGHSFRGCLGGSTKRLYR